MHQLCAGRLSRQLYASGSRPNRPGHPENGRYGNTEVSMRPKLITQMPQMIIFTDRPAVAGATKADMLCRQTCRQALARDAAATAKVCLGHLPEDYAPQHVVTDCREQLLQPWEFIFNTTEDDHARCSVCEKVLYGCEKELYGCLTGQACSLRDKS